MLLTEREGVKKGLWPAVVQCLRDHFQKQNVGSSVQVDLIQPMTTRPGYSWTSRRRGGEMLNATLARKGHSGQKEDCGGDASGRGAARSGRVPLTSGPSSLLPSPFH